MNRYFAVLLGVTISLLSMWGGAYAMNIFPYGHWANFPSFATAAAGMFGGAWLAIEYFMS